MEISFLGGTGTVTGSKYLFDDGDAVNLIDCGLFQGFKQLRLRNWQPLPIDPRCVSSVVLTHAHIDHSGYLPLLVSNGFSGRVYCSKATMELCQILLPDSAHLQEEEARYANKRGFSKHKPALPLYTVEDESRTRAFPRNRLRRTGPTVLHMIARIKGRAMIPEVPNYLNSPMAVEAMRIFHTYRSEHRLSVEECTAACQVAQFVNSPEASKELNRKQGPMIIISASGMATGGRVLHHLKAFAPDPKNMILFSGFQAAGTRGAAMVSGVETVKIHGEHVPVRAEVANLEGLSGHADYAEILDWLKAFGRAPEKICITHGEPAAADSMRLHIQESLGWQSRVPDYLEEMVVQ